MTLDEAKNNIGKEVIFTPYQGCKDEEKKIGVLISVGYIAFVEFKDRCYYKAVDSNQLELK